MIPASIFPDVPSRYSEMAPITRPTPSKIIRCFVIFYAFLGPQPVEAEAAVVVRVRHGPPARMDESRTNSDTLQRER